MIFYQSRIGFLSEHLNHVYGFFLFWQARGVCCRNKIVGISPRMYSHTRGADVHPQTTQTLARPKVFLIYKGSEAVVGKTTLLIM